MDKMDGHTLLKQIKKRHPELPVLLMTAYGTIQHAVEAMRDGAVDYLVKPFEAEVLVSKISHFATHSDHNGDGIIAVDPVSQQVFEMARRVAGTDATVMISGESGTGKELVARVIHQHSQRAESPFVAINCAAIPDNMLEAILYGYEKGAFTGAYKSFPGKFEQAQNGTLLLDEISEMSLGLQAKLLRVLQEREVERLGGNRMMSLDVRVLATSNQQIKDEVAAGRFREDLFYRLNVFPLLVPPLRERSQDIKPLAEYLLGCAAKASGKPQPILADDVYDRLMQYPWPGNVRELDNVMQRAFILQQGGTITVDELFLEGAEFRRVSTPVQSVDDAESLEQDLKIRERNLILDALKTGKGSRQFAARKLGISPRTLRYKLARMREQGVSIPVDAQSA